jgi:hypothetical protein
MKIRYESNDFDGRMAVHYHRIDHADEGILQAEDIIDGGVCDCSPKLGATGFTREPTIPPTFKCSNPPQNAIIQGKERPCSWILSSGGCSKKKNWSHCRVSCEKCQKCVDSGAKFKFNDPNSGTDVKKNCKYIAKNAPSLCADPHVAAACPKACGLC